MTTVHQDAIDALARMAVADVNPAELPVFRVTANLYRNDRAAALAAPRRSDEVLGFGAEAAVVLVTPYALELVRRLFDQLLAKLGERGAEAVAARITRSPRTSSASPERQALDGEQLRLIAETTRAEARGLALPAEQAERLADAIVAALATSA